MIYDIITFGSAVLDFFLDTKVKEKKGLLSLPAGEKIIVNDIGMSTGGGGTNTAVSFCKLGLKTAYVGALGKDFGGDIILRELKKNKIDFLGKIGKGKTGMSIILEGRKDRTIYSFKGENSELEFKDIKIKELKTRWVYFSSMIGESFETQKKLIDYFYKKKTKIAFNPGKYQSILESKAIREMIKKTDVLVLNKEEAEAIVGGKNSMEKLRKLGAKIVCVTNGEREIIASDGLYTYSAKPRGGKVVDMTGAGDSFASAFVAALMENKTLEEAIRWGCANAESNIRVVGAKEGLLNREQIIKEVKKRNVKIYKIGDMLEIK